MEVVVLGTENERAHLVAVAVAVLLPSTPAAALGLATVPTLRAPRPDPRGNLLVRHLFTTAVGTADIDFHRALMSACATPASRRSSTGFSPSCA